MGSILAAPTNCEYTDVAIYNEAMPVVENNAMLAQVRELADRHFNQKTQMIIMVLIGIWLMVSTLYTTYAMASGIARGIRHGYNVVLDKIMNCGKDLRASSHSVYSPFHGNAEGQTYIRRGPGGRTGACEGYAQCDLIDFETVTVEGLKRIARRWELSTKGLREHLVRRLENEVARRDPICSRSGFSYMGDQDSWPTMPSGNARIAGSASS